MSDDNILGDFNNAMGQMGDDDGFSDDPNILNDFQDYDDVDGNNPNFQITNQEIENMNRQVKSVFKAIQPLQSLFETIFGLY